MKFKPGDLIDLNNQLVIDKEEPFLIMQIKNGVYIFIELSANFQRRKFTSSDESMFTRYVKVG